MRTWIVTLCVCLSFCGTALANGVSIHRMVAGDRVLELQDTEQLTTHADGDAVGAWVSPDGKFVVYMTADESGEDHLQVCLARSSGGGHSVLMAVPKDHATSVPCWMPCPPGLAGECRPAWSPDSRLIALRATLLTPESTDNGVHYIEADYILVMTTAGLVRAQIPLPMWRDLRGVGRLYWSPDSRGLACVVRRTERSAPQPPHPMADVLVLDLASGTVKTACSNLDADVHIQRWMADSKSFHYVVKDALGWQVMEWHVDGRPDSLVETVKTLENTSPDGRWKKDDCKGLCVQDCATGETRQVFKDSAVDFAGWTPDSKLLIYRQPFKISDLSGKRSRDLNSVWLAVAEDQKLNHMCIALDADKDCASSFSSDNTKFAYVCQGRVCLAQLGWVPLEIDEKLAAGMPLTENEEKDCLMSAAKQIGVAAMMYADDHDDAFPTDAFMDEMGPYVPGADVFNRPGTDQMAFQYTPLGKTSDVSNPAETELGSFDVGYQWRVILYADGHVRVVPK
jgi:hypothetical protein